jgi:hypothetical protein
MPRISKSKTTDLIETASVVSTPVVVVTEPVVKAKKPKVVKTESPVTTTVATSSVAVAATSSVAVAATSSSVVAHEELVVEDVEASIVAQSVEFMSKLNQLSSMVASLKTEYRTLEKKWSRELKAAQKTSSKKKKRAGNRAPSGFVKPTRISDELAVFLGKDKGSEMARTDVTREINKYIRSHNLQDASNGRKINPDSKLQTLLRLNKTDELTYFNLQRYMSPHFHKADKLLATTA